MLQTRRRDVQPIRADLADLLRPFLAGKAAGAPVFPMPMHTERMIRHDLDAARQAWLQESATPAECYERFGSDFLAYRDAAGRFADFHASRATYVTRLVRSGANVKAAMELARHSTPTLTLKHYTHFAIADAAKALDALPVIGTTTPEQGAAALRATGTYDGRAEAAEGAQDAPQSPRIADRGPTGPDGRPRRGHGAEDRVAPGAARVRCLGPSCASVREGSENGRRAEPLETR